MCLLVKMYILSGTVISFKGKIFYSELYFELHNSAVKLRGRARPPLFYIRLYLCMCCTSSVTLFPFDILFLVSRGITPNP